MDITKLPNDIFLMIAAHLSPRDLILCRPINKNFHAAFTEAELNRKVLLQHYPRTRDIYSVDPNVNWPQVFAKVAGRYHYLQAGQPRSISKLVLARSSVIPQWPRYYTLHYPVAPWERRIKFEEETAPFHYTDTLWTYEAGILLFPSAELGKYVLY